jgi:hypothetical protein
MRVTRGKVAQPLFSHDDPEDRLLVLVEALDRYVPSRPPEDDAGELLEDAHRRVDP